VKVFFHFLQFISSSPTLFFCQLRKKVSWKEDFLLQIPCVWMCEWGCWGCISEDFPSIERRNFSFLFYLCVCSNMHQFSWSMLLFFLRTSLKIPKKLFGYLNSLLSLPPSIHPKWGSNIENGQVRKKTRGNWISFFYIQSLSVHYVYPSSFKSWKIWIHKSATSSTLLLISNGSSIERDSEKIILLLSFP